MVKAVFIQNSTSIYNDLPGHAYHFPKQYLSSVTKAVGDWVLLYESGRSGGISSYYAVQKIARIEADPILDDHYYAFYEKGVSSRFDFITPVPLKDDSGQYIEKSSPAFQSAVREISEDAFWNIVALGTQSIEADGFGMPREGEIILPPPNPEPILSPIGFDEPRIPFIGQRDARENILTSRKFRDRLFRERVVRAYQGRCAISGMELRNGGGRAEVQAAHIKSVADDGPDIVLNGLALSGTVHWLFDRKLISVDEDHSILIAKDSIANDMVGRLINPGYRLIIPDDPKLQPHPSFLKWHRQKFKG